MHTHTLTHIPYAEVSAVDEPSALVGQSTGDPLVPKTG